MKECTKCKSNEYINKNLTMMINECGHPLCRNCVENLFARNSAPCHVCGKTLAKNNFWEQQFDDPLIEKENYNRKRLKKIFNKKQDDFVTLKEYNDYLEKFEEMVFNLAHDIDVEETQSKINTYADENKEIIERNRRKLDADQKWILDQLKEDRAMKDRLASAHLHDDEDIKHSAIADSKAIIEEIRQSNESAEAILDRERKKQIEIDMAEKTKAAERKRANKEITQARKENNKFNRMSFITQARQTGKRFEYVKLNLPRNGVKPISAEDILAGEYLQHVRQPSTHRVAGGFTALTGCERALFECRIDLIIPEKL